MIAESEILEALPKAFWLAFLLTGSMDAAETSVLEGIAALESCHPSGGSLQLTTAKAAIKQRTESLQLSNPHPCLRRPELQRLFLLEPKHRDCFVLRILMRLGPELCSGILPLSILEVDETLRGALHELARIASLQDAEGTHI
jgi:hypothetical protein